MFMSLAWAASATSAAGAQASRPGRSGRFVLEIKACPEVAPEAIRRILVIEIGDLLVETGEAVPADSDRLAIRCAGNLAWVEAAADEGAKPVDRTLRLDDFPGDAAPRALALAGIEALAALSPAVRERIQAKQKPAQPGRRVADDRAESAESPPAEGRGLRVGAAGVWRTFLRNQGVAAWGGQVNLSRELARRWQLEVDVETAGTSRHVALGDTSGLLFSGAAFFGARGGGKSLGVSLCLGGRMGVARLAGSAADAANVSAASVLRAWGGPAAHAGAMVGFGPLALTLSVEAGRSLFTREGAAGGATVLSIGGTWVAISLGGALRLKAN